MLGVIGGRASISHKKGQLIAGRIVAHDLPTYPPGRPGARLVTR
jgi:hypothetical protein